MKRKEVSGKGGFSLSDLQKIFSIVRKNWWIVIILGGISLGLGYLYVYKQEKIYVSSTQLLLKNNEEYSSGSLIGDNSGFYGNTYKTFIDNSNEIRVLESQDLIEKVLQRLDFDVSYYLVGRLRTTEVYSGVPFSVHLKAMNPQLYEQQISFKILSFEEYMMEYTFNTQIIQAKGKFNEEFVNPQMHILVTRKPSFSNKSFQNNQSNYLIQPHRTEDLAKSFLSRLQVDNPQYTNVLKISVQDVLPERANRFLDTLSQVYIENSLESRIDINKNTLYYIDKQMDEVSMFLDNIEDSLQLYRQNNKVIDLDRQMDLYFKKYSGYDDQKRSVELQQMALNDLEKYIIEDKDPAFLPPSTYLLPNDEFQTTTINDLYQKQKNLNTLMTVATPANQVVQQIKSQIDSTKRDILIYIGNARQALVEKNNNIETEMKIYDEELQIMPIKQRGLLNIMRLQRVNQDMYLFLLQKRANTIIGRASIIPLTKVIERPRTAGIVSPNENKLIMTFTAIGLILSVIIVLIRVLFFHRIESYDELKSSTSLPILGDVVLSPENKDLIIAVEHSPKSPIAESFRTIRTNLQYMTTGEGAHVIVVTSNSPGEGKTYCSLNLAAVIAKGGRKVILLELDLHKPRIHKGLKMSSDIGISTIAIGKSTIEEAVSPTHIENLYTILAGPLPPNPSELITSRAMRDILAYCKKHFEYVIIDTPPVGLITDALVLIKEAEVAMFVLNTKFPSRNSLETVDEIAAMNNNVNFGLVLNGVRKKRAKYYYNRYGYGYAGNYGGGYGGSYGGYGSYGSYGASPKGKRKQKKKDDNADSE